MKALIVYESMFGNTRKLAEAIAQRIESVASEATLTTAASAPNSMIGFDLVIVGAPTHAHSLPRPASREQAVQWAADASKALTLEADAERPGVREWLDGLDLSEPRPRFATFGTRADIPRIFAGDAAAAIAKRLERKGARVESRGDFLVDLDNRLVEGEEERAGNWAADLVAAGSRRS